MTAHDEKLTTPSRIRWLWFGTSAAIIVFTALIAVCRTGSANAGGEQPMVSPDRADDAPAAAGDSFSAVGNFAWRAFIALNWPSMLGAADRGAPDRTKSLGDPGKRVWETFKSDAELFEIGLTVFTCSTNKILVSLGVDDPENVEEVMGIRIHEDFYPPWP